MRIHNAYTMRLQVTYYAYHVLLSALLAATAAEVCTLRWLVAEAVQRRHRGTMLQLLAAVAALLLCAHAFHYRWLLAVLCTAIAPALVVRAPAGCRLRAVSTAVLLCGTGAFTCLPLQRVSSITLAVVPCGLWVAFVLWQGRPTSSSAPSGTQRANAERHDFPSASLKRAVAQAQSALTAQALGLCTVAVCMLGTHRVSEDSAPAHGSSTVLARVHAKLLAMDARLAHAAAPLRPLLQSAVQGLGGPTVAQLVLWSLFVSVPALALLAPPQPLPRLLAVCAGLAAPFAIMSTSWEGLFLFSLSATAIAGMQLILRAQRRHTQAAAPRVSATNEQTGHQLPSKPASAAPSAPQSAQHTPLRSPDPEVHLQAAADSTPSRIPRKPVTPPATERSHAEAARGYSTPDAAGVQRTSSLPGVQQRGRAVSSALDSLAAARSPVSLSPAGVWPPSGAQQLAAAHAESASPTACKTADEPFAHVPLQQQFADDAVPASPSACTDTAGGQRVPELSMRHLAPVRTKVPHSNADSVKGKSITLRHSTALQHEDVTMTHLWAAVLVILGINLAFFGTGNVASVASFEPASVLRLTTCATDSYAVQRAPYVHVKLVVSVACKESWDGWMSVELNTGLCLLCCAGFKQLDPSI